MLFSSSVNYLCHNFYAKLILAASVFFLLSCLQAADFPSKNTVIASYTQQIEKIEDQIALEQSRTEKNTRELRYLLDKRNRLLEQKMKKMLDMKDDFLKDISSNESAIEKLQKNEGNKTNEEKIKKLQARIKTDEASIKELDSGIDDTLKVIKKIQDEEKKELDKKKEEKEKKKPAKAASSSK